MLPVLTLLGDGVARHRRTIADSIADDFNLSVEERSQMLPSGKSPVFRSRAGWALSYMKQAGLVTSPRRGWYAITTPGKEVLTAIPARIDNDFLMRFEGFRDFRAFSRGRWVRIAYRIQWGAGHPPSRARGTARRGIGARIRSLTSHGRGRADGNYQERDSIILRTVGYRPFGSHGIRWQPR